MGLGRKAGKAALRLRRTVALRGGAGGWRPERPWLSRTFAGHRSGWCYLFLATQTEEQEIIGRRRDSVAGTESNLQVITDSFKEAQLWQPEPSDRDLDEEKKTRA